MPPTTKPQTTEEKIEGLLDRLEGALDRVETRYVTERTIVTEAGDITDPHRTRGQPNG